MLRGVCGMLRNRDEAIYTTFRYKENFGKTCVGFIISSMITRKYGLAVSERVRRVTKESFLSLPVNLFPFSPVNRVRREEKQSKRHLSYKPVIHAAGRGADEWGIRFV